MKKVLILFGRSDWDNAEPFLNQDYRRSYERFYDLCAKGGVRLYRASYQWYDDDRQVFKHAWMYDGPLGGWKKVNAIEPDLVYDKTRSRPEVHAQKKLINGRYTFVNELEFTRIVDDKFETSLLFPEWSKKNFRVRSESELATTLSKLETDRIVVKPVSESGGKGVCVIEKTDITGLDFDSDTIVQEFIDSSKGVPGLSSKMHDLRLVFVGKKLVYAYIREPKDGGFLANLSQGGTLTIAPIDRLPPSLRPIMRRIHEVFASFSERIFAADFMFDEDGRPWIVELNSMPGLFSTPEEEPFMMELYGELLNVFRKKLTSAFEAKRPLLPKIPLLNGIARGPLFAAGPLELFVQTDIAAPLPLPEYAVDAV